MTSNIDKRLCSFMNNFQPSMNSQEADEMTEITIFKKNYKPMCQI